ncbi:MAG: hypothetical protein NTY30_04810 [Candidatus Berkelbacteria bacterium]|nr:hypothetical protein [Candidatus Berkelbacteria bacterium]
MLKVQCPVCHGDVAATIRGGKLVVGQHTDDRGGECDGWGKQLDLPTGMSISPDQPSSTNDSGNFGGGLSEY